MTIVHQAPTQSKPECLDVALGQMRDFVRQAAEHGRSAYDVEKRLFK